MEEPPPPLPTNPLSSHSHSYSQFLQDLTVTLSRSRSLSLSFETSRRRRPSPPISDLRFIHHRRHRHSKDFSLHCHHRLQPSSSPAWSIAIAIPIANASPSKIPLFVCDIRFPSESGSQIC